MASTVHQVQIPSVVPDICLHVRARCRHSFHDDFAPAVPEAAGDNQGIVADEKRFTRHVIVKSDLAVMRPPGGLQKVIAMPERGGSDAMNRDRARRRRCFRWYGPSGPATAVRRNGLHPSLRRRPLQRGRCCWTQRTEGPFNSGMDIHECVALP
jgi:hypothetical protein